MSSSSPSSSSPPSRSRKRTAKAGGLDTPEGWMPKIRIINFDPTRNPADTAIKTHLPPTPTPTTTDPSQPPTTSTPNPPPQHTPSFTDLVPPSTGDPPIP